MKSYNTRFLIILTAVIAILLLFKNAIIKVLLTIGNIIDYQSLAYIIGYIIITILLLALSIKSCKKKYIPHKNITFFVGILFFIYLYLRFFEKDKIQFTQITPWLNHADIIILISIIFAINIYLIYKTIRNNSQEPSYFLQDNLFDAEELANERILTKLMSSLTNFKPEIAFTIGINAVWGYGKSSFLNKFKKDYTFRNPETIVFWYRVWKNKGENAIIENFFEELSNILKPYSGEINSEFKGYVDSILQLPSNELGKLIAMGRDAINGNETLEEYFIRINQSILKIDKQIIVLLDDLDRLEKDEILTTLKLIRTLSDFNNLIFIIGYDRKYLVETIEKPKDNYLDKVFNVEINLLPFDENLITQMLYKEIDKAFPQITKEIDVANLSQSFKNLFEKNSFFFPFNMDIGEMLDKIKPCSTYKLSYLDFLETFRDVKRFVNEFKFNVSFIENVSDVIQSEYILLKLLTYKYRYAQDLILNKLNIILSGGKIVWDKNEINTNKGLNHDIYIYDEYSKKIVQDLLRDKPNQDFEIINAVLCELFISRNFEFYEVNQTSISKIYYTDLYIRNNIASGNISITQIQKAFEKFKLHVLVKDIGDDPLKKEFTIQNELKYFVFKNSAKSIEQFQDVVLSLNLFMSEGIHRDDEKVLEILHDGLKQFYKGSRTAFIDLIKEVLEICNIGYLDKILSDININIKRKEQKEKYPSGILEYKNNFFTPKELEYLMLAKLNALIKQKYDVSTIINGYHLLVDKITASQNVVRPLVANKILRNEIETNFIIYYNSSLFKMISERADHSEGEFIGYQPNDFLVQVFSSEEAHNHLIKNLNDNVALEKYKVDGIKNLLSFLKSVGLKEKQEQDQVNRTIKIIEKYIAKNYKPLNSVEYDEIWNNNIF